MGAVVPRDEVEVVAIDGIQRRPDRRRARAGDRPRRQPPHRVRVVGVLGLQVLLGDVLRVLPAQEHHRVDHRRVRLQRHPQPQPVVEHAGDPRALLRRAGFLLDDRRQGHRVEQQKLDPRPASRLGLAVLLQRARHHLRQHRLLRRPAREGVGVRVEEALQRVGWYPQLPDALRRLGDRLQPPQVQPQLAPRHDRQRLVHPQPLRHGEAVDLHLPGDDLLDHLHRRERTFEFVLPGLELRAQLLAPEIDEEVLRAAHHSLLGQKRRNPARPGAGRNLDDLRLRRPVGLAGEFPDPPSLEPKVGRRRRAGEQRQREQREQEPLHSALSSAPGRESSQPCKMTEAASRSITFFRFSRETFASRSTRSAATVDSRSSQ